MSELQFDVELFWAGRGREGAGRVVIDDLEFDYSAPGAMGVRDTGSKPEELLVCAVATCSATLFGVLRHERLPVTDVRIGARGTVTGYPVEARSSVSRFRRRSSAAIRRARTSTISPPRRRTRGASSDARSPATLSTGSGTCRSHRPWRPPPRRSQVRRADRRVTSRARTHLVSRVVPRLPRDDGNPPSPCDEYSSPGEASHLPASALPLSV